MAPLNQTLYAIAGTAREAIMAPTFDPELKIPVARARSFLGNQLAMVFIEDGKLPASPIPNKERTIACTIAKLPAKAFKIPKNDQIIRDKASPNFDQILSITNPAKKVIIA